MSLNRYNPTRDANEPEIIELYRARGCSVHRIINGPSDLIVGYYDTSIGPQTISIEVKTPDGKLTPREMEFHGGHKGRHYIVRDEADVDRSLDMHSSAIVSKGCR